MSDPWTTLPAGLAYGGDYNPEQWPPETWKEDVRLMREAGRHPGQPRHLLLGAPRAGARALRVRLAGRVLDLLHADGIAVDLATPTAAPPAWFYARPSGGLRSPTRPASGSGPAHAA